jgi:hypothetical protein
VAKVIERIQAHYEVQDVEMGEVYRWHPESVVVECYCGKEQTLTASKNACSECGANHRTIIEEALKASPEDEVYHPWRSPGPSYYAPTKGA